MSIDIFVYGNNSDGNMQKTLSSSHYIFANEIVSL